jgi:hypothetical protein
LRDYAAAAFELHSEAAQAADAGAEESATVVAALHSDTGATTAESPAPVEQLEVGGSSPDGASDEFWSSFSEDDYKAQEAAFELVGSSPWVMLHVDDKPPLATLRSSLSEAAAARLEPQLWRLQVIMCGPSARRYRACLSAFESVNAHPVCIVSCPRHNMCATHAFS